MDKKIVKAFVEASGKFKPEKACDPCGLYRSSCNMLSTCEHHIDLYIENCLVIFENPVNVMAAIQSWPCDKCGGSGEYVRPELFEDDPLAMSLMAQAIEKGTGNVEKETCPDCLDGKHNLWPDFMGWLWAHKVDPQKPGREVSLHYSRLFLNPELLIENFLEFMGIEIEAGK